MDVGDADSRCKERPAPVAPFSVADRKEQNSLGKLGVTIYHQQEIGLGFRFTDPYLATAAQMLHECD